MRGVPSLVNPESPSHHQAGKTQFSLGEKPRCVCVWSVRGFISCTSIHSFPCFPVLNSIFSATRVGVMY
jgi:hypothetical protein